MEAGRQGSEVDVATFRDDDQGLFAAAGRGGEQEPDRLVACIAPGVRDAALHLYGLTCCSLESCFAEDDSGRAFEDEEVLVFPLMNMQGRAVAGIGYDLND